MKGYTDDLLSIVCKQLGVKVDLQLPADKDLVAPDYVDDVDRIYSEKQEVWKKHYEGKLSEISRLIDQSGVIRHKNKRRQLWLVFSPLMVQLFLAGSHRM